MGNTGDFASIFKLLAPGGAEQTDLLVVDRTILSEILGVLPNSELEKLIKVAKATRIRTLLDRISDKAREIRKSQNLTQSELATKLSHFGLKLKQEDVSFLEKKSGWGKFGLERLIDIDQALSFVQNSKAQT